MLFLQKENKHQDINLYINSPGGLVTAGLAIYDTMQFVQCDVATYCIGQAASMGAVLLAAGAKGKRFALPHSRVMIHQPWGGARGTAADIEIHAEEILKMRDDAQHDPREATPVATSRTSPARHRSRQVPLRGTRRKEYGLVDEVVETLKEDQRID